jgi:hypothetical protein
LQSSADQLSHALARRLAAVADLEKASDLAEGEARGLGGTDEASRSMIATS